MSNEILKLIGKNIRELRNEKGIKGETLGKALKKTKASVSLMENGLIDFKISTLHRISNILGVNMAEIVCSCTFHALQQYKKSENREEMVLINSKVIERLLNKIEKLNLKLDNLSNSSQDLKRVG